MTFEEMAAGTGTDTRKYLWTVPEVAEILGVPSRTLYDEISAGRLSAARLAHRKRPMYLSAGAIDLWLNEEWE